MFRSVVRWLPAIAWMAVIFGLSSVPGSNLPGRFGTAAHFATYAILGGLLVLPLRPNRSTGAAIAIAVILASAYAITDEFHQSFVPMRTPDVADWGVDTLGSFAGACAVAYLADRFERRGGSERRDVA